MNVRLAYGKEGLDITVPNDAMLVEPRFVAGIEDEAEALRLAMRNPVESPPLHSLVKPGDTVTIVHSDITRPMPNDRVLPVVIDELREAGIRPEEITLLNGLGTHRPQTRDELIGMLGQEIVETYPCLQHDCWDDDSEGAISTWYFDDGDKVALGDVVCEVMNEKVSTEILAPASGVLKIEVLAETPVKKGAVIASVSS